jgi:hypothetical protein
MYGVPDDLDLSGFSGLTVTRVCVDAAQVQVYFEQDHYVGIEGAWELIDSGGQIVGGRSRDRTTRESKADLLVGLRVLGNAVSPPDWFELRFDNGTTLKVYDDSEQYESFSIQPGNIFI